MYCGWFAPVKACQSQTAAETWVPSVHAPWLLLRRLADHKWWRKPGLPVHPQAAPPEACWSPSLWSPKSSWKLGSRAYSYITQSNRLHTCTPQGFTGESEFTVALQLLPVQSSCFTHAAPSQNKVVTSLTLKRKCNWKRTTGTRWKCLSAFHHNEDAWLLIICVV